MCNLFLDIILFAILLIFMVLLMILLDTTQTMYYVCSNISSVVEFQRWWVLKSKIFAMW